MRIITTEQISKFHPDKYADQISDAIVDACLRQDINSKVACEVLVKDTTVVLAGEIKTNGIIDYYKIVKRVATKLGYKVDKIINLIGEQSQEINSAVDTSDGLKAGDQGIMFGYACRDTQELLPIGMAVANAIIKILEYDVDNNPTSILKGDAKCQVAVNDGTKEVLKVIISVCSKDNTTLPQVREYVKKLIGFVDEIELIVNPAGLWTIGGATADCGLTGRKIVCDQYGAYSTVGGGAFSGKDPSKVDRSGAYKAREIAKDYLLKGNLNWCEVQLSYAIGKAEPLAIYIDSNEGNITPDKKLYEECKPLNIIKDLKLKEIKFEKLAQFGHFN